MFRRRQLLPCFSSYCLNSHITLVWRLSLQTASSFFQKLWSWFTQHAALTCFAATSFCIVSKATVMIRITLVWLVLPTSASFHEIPVQSWFEQHVCVTFLAVINLCLVSQAIVAIRTVRSFDVFHRSPLLCFTSYCRDPSKYVCLTNFAATNSALFHKLLSWFEHYVRLTVFTAANVCFVSQATVMLRATCLFDTFHCRQPVPRFTSYMYCCDSNNNVSLTCLAAANICLVSQAPMYRFDGHARFANHFTAPHEPTLAVFRHRNLLLGVTPVAAQ